MKSIFVWRNRMNYKVCADYPWRMWTNCAQQLQICQLLVKWIIALDRHKTEIDYIGISNIHCLCVCIIVAVSISFFFILWIKQVNYLIYLCRITAVIIIYEWFDRPIRMNWCGTYYILRIRPAAMFFCFSLLSKPNVKTNETVWIEKRHDCFVDRKIFTWF